MITAIVPLCKQKTWDQKKIEQQQRNQVAAKQEAAVLGDLVESLTAKIDVLEVMMKTRIWPSRVRREP